VLALVALVTLLSAAAGVLIGIAVHLAAVIVATLGLLGFVICCWYAVSRRGMARMLSAAVAAAALAAATVGLILSGISLWRLALVIALSALSVGAARRALRRGAAAIRADAARQAMAARPGHPVLIMNPKSGGGKAERFRLAEECRKRGIEPVLLRPGDDLLQLADAAAAGRFAALEAAGQVRRFPGWLEWSPPRFEVSADGPVEIGVDGEALIMDSPVVFESRPGALRVRLPRRTVGLSPAARAVHLLSGSTVAELWQVAMAPRSLGVAGIERRVSRRPARCRGSAPARWPSDGW
jgi:hypothetical protein